MLKKLVHKFKSILRWTNPKLYYSMREVWHWMEEHLGFLAKRMSFRLDIHLLSLANVNLQPGDVAIDCGANVGNITARMASTGATVYAFEPNPYAFQILKRRFARAPNVHCINKGVLDRNDKLRLYLPKNACKHKIIWSEGSSLLSCKRDVNVETFIEISVIDLAQFINDLNTRIRVVKMDVEGVESQIINKLIDSGLIKKIELLLVELHDKQIPSLKKKTDKLRRRIVAEKLTNINLDWT